MPLNYFLIIFDYNLGIEKFLKAEDNNIKIYRLQENK